MNRFARVSGLGLALVLAFAACSSSDSAGAAAAPVNDGGGTEDQDGAIAEGGPAADANVDPAQIPRPTACPASKYKTLVVVGDSISDVGGSGGGTGQQPFYRTLLVKNDDTLYPDYRGFDLSTCWGLDPTANVVKVSKGGAVGTVPANNTPGNAGVLLNQVVSLPATLPGPVLVVGTIGGNDVQAGLVTAVTGTPAQFQAKVDAFIDGFRQAMTELSKPDRFGVGVKVSVLMTNIYDPSGGTGHFYYEPSKATCPGGLGLWPDGKETAPLLAQWNDAMAVEAPKHAGLRLVELRAPFVAHAVTAATASNWFYRDCIHPSTLGHDAIRGIFWQAMVALP